MPEDLSAIEALIDSKMADKDRQIEELSARLEAAEAKAAAASSVAGTPLTLVPEHGAGPGMDVAETWSQYEQTAAIQAAESA